MFESLNPLLNNELRLSIMSLLVGFNSADFKFIQEKTKATAGNLSIQLQKLSDASYIEINKTFKNNYPHTTCKITEKGIIAFEDHYKALSSYFKHSKK